MATRALIPQHCVPVSAILILLLISSLVLGRAPQKKLKMHNKASAMKEEILKRIAIGSNIDDARKIMEANEFVCQMMERTGYSEQDNTKRPVLHEGIDYLYCDKELRSGLFCERRWQIAIVHKSGIVSGVLVSIGLTCL